MSIPHPDALASLSPQPLPSPPLPPRAVSGKWFFRLFLADPGVITGLVFTIIGGVFTPVGLFLAFSLHENLLGWIFFPLGLAGLIVGVWLLLRGIRTVQSMLRLQRDGQSVLGEIDELGQDYSMTINDRHPWIITYHFTVFGGEYTGRFNTLRDPDAHIQPGAPVYVLYDPDRPERNTLYSIN